MRVIAVYAICVVLCGTATAGGPAYVVGTSYFDPATTGTPVAWPKGLVNYYTDQGDLSPLLSGAAADSLVADAFSQWTSIPTAAVSAVHAGQLSEDVSAANVISSGGRVYLPGDIQPAATGTPVGIIYDFDGSVTDALLGMGASGTSYCADNSVLGGIDNIGTNAEFVHAIIIINGNCASSSSQLSDLRYHLTRMIGRVLGVDWSQTNINVLTKTLLPTLTDYAGLPLMHQIDPQGCVPIASCYPYFASVDPAQPKWDDIAALSRLYPVTAQNVANFAGKEILATTTARIRGAVYFDDGTAKPGQAMQGVNVVARWVDPATGLPSREYVVASISGFLFHGNAGNMVSGNTDSAGNRFYRYGSDDPGLQGFFDLAGLPLPGGAQATYELTVEAVDPVWSANAGPYGSTSQVTPSGAMLPMRITVVPGADIQVDLVMNGSAMRQPRWYSPANYASPTKVPPGGIWNGTLTPVTDFFWFPAQANRSLSIIVDALDEAGAPSGSKALPVIGLWAMSDPGQSPAPAYTPSAFNTVNLGETRLDAQILQSAPLRIGIADYRGDGRPDYEYNARVFYGGHITPARASGAGGTPVTISGLGLQADTTAQLANTNVPVLARSATQLLVTSPLAIDGIYDVQLSDARTAASSKMSGVLTIGAGPSDTLKLLSGAASATPVGGQVNIPFKVAVLAPDGVSPIAGASVQFSSSPPVAFSACSGGSSCTVFSDQQGIVSTSTMVLAPGVTTLTAKLAPASYARPQQVQATILVLSSSLDISLLTPSVSIAQGATISVPLSARVLSNGNPVNGALVNYQITQGTGTLSRLSAQTGATGYASVDLLLNAFTTAVQVSVCAGANNSPCLIFRAFPVPASSLTLVAVGGNLQVVRPGQSLQPFSVRVVDLSTPPNPVLGASVLFESYLGRVPGDQLILWAGESTISRSSMPVILAKSQGTILSDMNGVALFPISTQGFSGNIAVIGSATAGNTSLPCAAQQLGP
jgi:hypothetical protein